MAEALTGGAPAQPESEDSHAWTYTVSVRSLCEFTAKRGDLDRRFTPAATALQGLQGQSIVASRRSLDYETEVPLETVCGPLRVRGRADGYDPRRRCLEEVKTIRGQPEDIPENRRHLHWAQLLTYGALFCRERGVEELALALVYFDIVSQTESEMFQVFGAAELEETLLQRCAAFEHWAAQEAAHRQARDAALRTLGFPPGDFRQGQRSLAQAAYRALAGGGHLLAQAPTGIGKTIGTLFPALRAMGEKGLDRIAYLTCKGTAQGPALQALEQLRQGLPRPHPDRPLRVLALMAKEASCEHPDKACHGQSCPLARGFYDRLPAARAQAAAQGWLDATAQKRIAREHGICPYYLGQEMVRWSDVLVGDVNHVFDGIALLWGLSQSLDWRLGLLVDEAHNLVERARQMYSASLSSDALAHMAQIAPAGLRLHFMRLQRALEDVAPAQGATHAALEDLPDALALALQALGAALADHFQGEPLATGPLLDFHFHIQQLLRLTDTLGSHSLLDVTCADIDLQAASSPTVASPRVGFDASANTRQASTDSLCLNVRNVVPAPFLRPRWAALHGAVLFSATLSPPDYQTNLLGLPEGTGWLDVPPVFPAEHLCVQVAERLSTRYAHRSRSLQTLAQVLTRQFDAHPGNYLAFFSSHDYLQQAATVLARQRPDIPQWRQERTMDATARRAFLERFEPQGRGIGFAVLGGVFAEGVDLPGSRLIGAFVATLGLPPVSPVQEALRTRLDQLFGPDHGYADLVPAMQKVVQAAGRVLRTPEDRGWLWLLDDRYR
ncbi:MAG: ATP-dependent DNA helicase, partial [Rubrivivax sp.]